MTELDKIWMKHLKELENYVNTYHLIPVGFEDDGNVNIRRWLITQRCAAKKGTLNEERIKLLNKINPYWNGTREEIEKENKKLLLSSNWKSNVPEDYTPIDKYYNNEEDIATCLYYGIFHCEALLESSKHYYIISQLSYFDKYDCFVKIKPFVDPRYLRLMCKIYGYEIYEFVNIRKKWVDTFAILSKEDMSNKLDTMIETLPELKREIICLRYGLKGNKPHSFLEISEKFNISKNTAGNEHARALQSLRRIFTNNNEIIFNTNTLLDDTALSRTRGILYRAGIDTEEKLIKFSKSNMFNGVIKTEVINFLDLLNDRRDLTKIYIDNIGLSDRVCRCLKETKIITISDLKSYEDRGDLLKIKGVGNHTANEISRKLNKYLKDNNLI